MKNQQKRILEILAKMESSEASPAELLELDHWYESFEDEPSLTAGMSTDVEESLRSLQLIRLSERLDKALASKVVTMTPIKVWKRLLVAASILLAVCSSVYLFMGKKLPIQITVHQGHDFAPGSNRAILRLSNGREIVLDDAHQGQLAAEGLSVIKKTADNMVIYDDDRQDNNTSTPVMNTMSTPRGGQYSLILSDGTKVWLNAGSSITYPVVFSGKTRDVIITGELYFEVSHNASKPFRVRSSKQTIEVLGTHFNVNDYGTEQIARTTLLEGSVAVANGQLRKMLRPGEQARLSEGGLEILPVDITEAIAWKEGYFQFMDADVRTVMKQLSNWYDVDVEFVGPEPKELITGRVSRNRKLSQVLKILQDSKSMHVTFEGRRIIVRQ